MSYRIEVHGCGDRAGVWSTNALRFETEGEAQRWLDDLKLRWTGFDASQVVECTKPVTHIYIHGNTGRTLMRLGGEPSGADQG